MLPQINRGALDEEPLHIVGAGEVSVQLTPFLKSKDIPVEVPLGNTW